MDANEFRRVGKEMVDYIAQYMETVESRRVLPEKSPGYLRDLLPNAAPKQGEDWSSIMKDVEVAIMPGVTQTLLNFNFRKISNSFLAIILKLFQMTHWQHPHFHAYFPAGNSYPSILGDMLSNALGCVGFSWAASPACTELETIVLDWLGGFND